jgi:quercetin dioxygenase-like cupin family protein
MPPEKVDIDALAEALTEPFVMQRVAEVDHFAVYLYLCTGVVARHRHSMQDELFYVHSGALTLDTDWGEATLRRHEFAVVPQGVAHSSGSLARTIVLLFQAQGDPERRNGRGRFGAEGEPGRLQRWSALAGGNEEDRPREPLALASADGMSLRIVRPREDTPWHSHAGHDELLYLIEGELGIGSEQGPLALRAGEMSVISRGRIHRLTASGPSVAVSFIHRKVRPEEQLGQ